MRGLPYEIGETWPMASLSSFNPLLLKIARLRFLTFWQPVYNHAVGAGMFSNNGVMVVMQLTYKGSFTVWACTTVVRHTA